MSVPVSSHATAELLSAYLDRQLVEPEVERLEAHLEECQECHGRLEGLRKLVASLRRIESLDPPAELEKAVARRIALARDREPLLDRFESALSIFNRQSTILPMLGIVIALGVLIYMFSWALERDQHIPVIFADPPGVEDSSGTEPRRSAGRLLQLEGELWIEDGASPDAVSRTIELDSEPGRRLLADHPELEQLPRPAVILLDDEVVEIR
ncbi:MAG: anti-sigma factor [Thermoanaerobaculia bacterium]